MTRNYKKIKKVLSKLNRNEKFQGGLTLFSSRVQEQGRNGVLRKIRQPMGGFVFGAEKEREIINILLFCKINFDSRNIRKYFIFVTN